MRLTYLVVPPSIWIGLVIRVVHLNNVRVDRKPAAQQPRPDILALRCDITVGVIVMV